MKYLMWDLGGDGQYLGTVNITITEIILYDYDTYRYTIFKITEIT